MGIAFYIENAFTDHLEISPTPAEDIDIIGISINGNDSYIGQKGQLSVSYIPSNTNKTGVKWSITDGETYASIDENTGVLTIQPAANNSSVTVKAVSVHDNTVFSTKAINLTYKATVDLLDGISITGKSSVRGKSSQYSIEYNPFNTSYSGVVWSVVKGGSYVSINQNGLLTVNAGANGESVTVKAVSTHDSSIMVTKDVEVTYYSETTFDLSSIIGYVPLASWTDKASMLIEFEQEPIYVANGTGIYVFSTNPGQNTDKPDGWSYKRNIDYRWGLFSKGTTSTDWKSQFLKNSMSVMSLISNSDKWIADGVEYPSEQAVNSKVPVSGYLYFNCTKNEVSYADTYPTCESLQAAVNAGTKTQDVFCGAKISRFILFRNTKYSTVDDFVSNRASADIDIQIDDNGNPYNAGVGGSLVYARLK